MKTILILILATIPAFSETVTLTDTKGRDLTCEIISATSKVVSVRKADGKAFNVELSLLDEKSRKTITAFVAAENAKIAEAAAAAEAAKRIVVETVIIKQVDGKFRYFFYYRNKTDKPWEGEIRVNLVNQLGQKGMGEVLTSKVPMLPGRGGSFFIDARVGPPRVHGEYGHVAYSYEVISKDGKKIPEVVELLTTNESGF